MFDENCNNENICEFMDDDVLDCSKTCSKKCEEEWDDCCTNDFYDKKDKCKKYHICGKCPVVNPQHCCTAIVEHKTCLVPPAEEKCTVKHTVSVETFIEKVCPGKVLLCGVLHKKIKYKTITQCGKSDKYSTKYDDIAFQCCVDADEANEDDIYEIVGCEVVCTTGKVVNEGSYSCTGKMVFWGYEEKDVIKIAVRRKQLCDY